MRSADVIVVGGGHNGLVAAAYLARAGLDVELLERNGSAGGAVGSAELTEPGYIHDTWAAWHTQFVGSRAWRELGRELQERGLAYVVGELAAASVLADGETVVARHDLRETASELPNVDRDAYVAEMLRAARYGPYVEELLAGELRTRAGPASALALLRGLGPRESVRIGSSLATSARHWLRKRFRSRAMRALAAPWLLHAGLTPQSAGGGLKLSLMLAAKHRHGSPIVRGGGSRFVSAFERLIADHGGRVRTETRVESIVVRGGRAVGVRTEGEEIRARAGVIANVTPTQLYLGLLSGADAPARAIRQARRYRYGPGCMMIHAALREPLRWRDSRLDRAPLVHVTDGIDGIASACAQARADLLPARPTFAVGQQSVLDPSRAPAAAATLWIQLLQTPYAPSGDAARALDVSRGWDEELKQAYLQRVLALLAPHVHDASVVRAARVLAPPDLEHAIPNCRDGDPYAGAIDLRQSLPLRPLPSYGTHRTPVAGLWEVGASTFPGPGLNASSGRSAARQLLREARASGLRLTSPDTGGTVVGGNM